VIRDILLAPQPNKRFAEIDEVASLALYLASDAAQGVTGTSISIDGGWTAR
jgi:3-hydroxybutyrate dehydrogenase